MREIPEKNVDAAAVLDDDVVAVSDDATVADDVVRGDAVSDDAARDDARLQLYRDVLRIEKGWWTIARTREDAINTVLGISPMRYYLLLSQLLDNRKFWELDPVLVDRLRSLRDRRLEERGMLAQRQNSEEESKLGASELRRDIRETQIDADDFLTEGVD
ncbi:hypothetical protein JOD55_000464 [Arcanobacterium pluranimalium]|uniref:DUF3263 domain-containing protein n=1 Tax=Arcanobacterium pluranimalium TaxID=108028 RepID=UPI0019562FDF|nr:DUF3263 domain-containing protein [Arcanobacterium pluranimalium]MBM7824637.1 hypothetical protein [Arcanobacterium pluranimalium]